MGQSADGMRRVESAAAGLLLASAGCAGPVEVARIYTPDAAEQLQREKMVAVAVVRGGDRVALPRGARIEDHKVVLPHAHVHKLAPGDVIEQDELGRIVAVRSAGDPPIVTHFVPGTARSPSTSDEVRGELADDGAAIVLADGDGVEMRGRLSPDESVSGVGRVESTRATGALVGGLVLLALSYAPSAYVGAQASSDHDRTLEIPVAGPWMDLAQRPACVPPVTQFKSPIDPCIMETGARIALVTSGSLQGLGALLTLWGLPSRSHLVEGDDGGAARAKPHVAFVPTLTGITVAGSF
jgi:hypothetical protein